MSPQNAWSDFWRRGGPFPDSTWEFHADLFLKASHDLFPLRVTDKLLDIGCGPGIMAQAMQGQVASYTGLDVSAGAIQAARQRNQSLKTQYRFEVLPQQYLDFTALGSERYTRLLALSVVQYYREPQELEALLEAMKALAAPGAVMLVADLPLLPEKRRAAGQPLLGELLYSTWLAAKLGYFGKHVAFLIRCAVSDYRSTRAEQPLLRWSLSQLESIAQKKSEEWGAEVQLITKPITLSVGRAHLCFRLPE